MKALIFGDDADQLEFVAFVLRQAGLQPLATVSEERFLTQCAEEAPALIFLDTTSKEMDLLPLVARVRAESDVPLILAAPATDEEYILKALDLGVDDYLAKPHSPQMLVARAKVLLRRGQPIPLSALGPVTVQGLTLDPEQHLVTMPEGSTVRLTNMEFRLLYLLMRNPDRVIPTETIVDRVWGYGGKGEATLVKNLVSRVRRKVEPDAANPRFVKTVTGVGYSFSSTGAEDPS
ncbi:MAG: response regulator transcription factor [Anaerolineae bacterium]|jgi:DNA-binding response OmpR family regulator